MEVQLKMDDILRQVASALVEEQTISREEQIRFLALLGEEG